MPKPKQKTGDVVVYPRLEIILKTRDAAVKDSGVKKALEVLRKALESFGVGVGIEGPFTIPEIKDYMGWQTESEFLENATAHMSEKDKAKYKESHSFGSNYDFEDTRGEKVQLKKNNHNRPYERERSMKFAQDVLNLNWADSRNGGEAEFTLSDHLGGGTIKLPEMTLNGETIIIGRMGNVVSAQHRGPGWVFADQMREDQDHWAKNWPEPITVEGILVRGVSEDPKVVRTVDNVNTRTLTDVMFTEGFFKRIDNKNIDQDERIRLGRMTESALAMLWSRAGIGVSSTFNRFRTHSESLEFFRRHPHFLKCVEHIFEENKENAITRYVASGAAACLMYLMACSESDGKKWREKLKEGKASEKDLKLGPDKAPSLLDKAAEFWSGLSGRHQSVRAVYDAKRSDDHLPEELRGKKYFPLGATRGTADERISILIKCWQAFVKEGEVTEDTPLDQHKNRLAGPCLTYQKVDKKGNLLDDPILDDYPTLSGIDFSKEDKNILQAANRKEKESKEPEGDPYVEPFEKAWDFLAGKDVVPARPCGEYGDMLIDFRESYDKDDLGSQKKVREWIKDQVEESGEEGEEAGEDSEASASTATMDEYLDAMAENAPGRIVFVKHVDTDPRDRTKVLKTEYTAYRDDAKAVAKILGVKSKEINGTHRLTMAAANLEDVVSKLIEKGHKVAIAQSVNNEMIVEDVGAESAADSNGEETEEEPLAGTTAPAKKPRGRKKDPQSVAEGTRS